MGSPTFKKIRLSLIGATSIFIVLNYAQASISQYSQDESHDIKELKKKYKSFANQGAWQQAWETIDIKYNSTFNADNFVEDGVKLKSLNSWIIEKKIELLEKENNFSEKEFIVNKYHSLLNEAISDLEGLSLYLEEKENVLNKKRNEWQKEAEELFKNELVDRKKILVSRYTEEMEKKFLQKMEHFTSGYLDENGSWSLPLPVQHETLFRKIGSPYQLARYYVGLGDAIYLMEDSCKMAIPYWQEGINQIRNITSVNDISSLDVLGWNESAVLLRVYHCYQKINYSQLANDTLTLLRSNDSFSNIYIPQNMKEISKTLESIVKDDGWRDKDSHHEIEENSFSSVTFNANKICVDSQCYSLKEDAYAVSYPFFLGNRLFVLGTKVNDRSAWLYVFNKNTSELLKQIYIASPPPENYLWQIENFMQFKPFRKVVIEDIEFDSGLKPRLLEPFQFVYYEKKLYIISKDLTFIIDPLTASLIYSYLNDTITLSHLYSNVAPKNIQDNKMRKILNLDRNQQHDIFSYYQNFKNSVIFKNLSFSDALRLAKETLTRLFNNYPDAELILKETILNDIKNTGDYVRGNAILLLSLDRARSFLSPDETNKIILNGLSDESAYVRLCAAYTILLIVTIDKDYPFNDLVKSSLISAIKDSNPFVRFHAAFTILAIKYNNDEAIWLTLPLILSDSDPKVRYQVAKYLKHFFYRNSKYDKKTSDKLVEFLIPALHHENDLKTKSEIAFLLSAIGESAVQPLLNLLGNVELDEITKGLIVGALGVAGDQRAVGIFQKLLLDKKESQNVRKEAAIALGDIKSKESGEALVKILNDSDPIIRSAACYALGIIKEMSDSEKDVFSKLIKDEHSLVRGQTAIALGKMNIDTGIDNLEDFIKDESPYARAAFAYHLYLMKDKKEKILHASEVMLNDNDPRVKFLSIHALRRLLVEELEGLERLDMLSPEWRNKIPLLKSILNGTTSTAIKEDALFLLVAILFLLDDSDVFFVDEELNGILRWAVIDKRPQLRSFAEKIERELKLNSALGAAKKRGGGESTANSREPVHTHSPELLGEFVSIPAGSFMMGSPSNESGRYDDETQHQVTITQGFQIMKTEVTQRMWKKVMGSNSSFFRGENLPVDQVSWNDVQIFIDRLNQKNNGYTYRLPINVEWMYAWKFAIKTAYSDIDNKERLRYYGYRWAWNYVLPCSEWVRNWRNDTKLRIQKSEGVRPLLADKPWTRPWDIAVPNQSIMGFRLIRTKN